MRGGGYAEDLLIAAMHVSNLVALTLEICFERGAVAPIKALGFTGAAWAIADRR